MITKIYIFERKGSVSGIFGIIPAIINGSNRNMIEDNNKNKATILSFLRQDFEKKLFGGGGPEENPSKDPSLTTFVYYPFLYKQEMAKNIPHKISQTVTLIDSFTCLGSRFGLDSLQVIVEVCESSCGGNRIWANIFYVADCEIPACIITVNTHLISLENENITGS